MEDAFRRHELIDFNDESSINMLSGKWNSWPLWVCMSYSDAFQNWIRNFCMKSVWAAQKATELLPVPCETEKKMS